MEINLENARQRIQDGGFYTVTWRHKNEIKRLLSYLLEQAAFQLIKAEFFEEQNRTAKYHVVKVTDVARSCKS